MRIFKSLVSVSMMPLVFIGCTKVSLERGQNGPGSEVTSSQQLADPAVVDLVLPQLERCEGADSETYACLLIMDSFERSSIDKSISDGGFGWSSLIDDVLGQNGDRVEANIYNADATGANPDSINGSEGDEGRSLVYTGRPGGSVHSIFLVSEAMDLTNFNSVLVSFQYLAISLEEWNWKGKTGNEHIRLEVCESSLENCGVADGLDEGKLNSANWSVRYQSAAGAGSGLNGHNQSLDDWKTAAVDIDLSQMAEAQKRNFVFRLTVTLDEGFENETIAGNLVDGIALDNVIAMASKVTVPEEIIIEEPEPTPNNGDDID